MELVELFELATPDLLHLFAEF